MLPSTRRSDSRLFLVLLALSALHVLFLAGEHRVPSGAPTFGPGGLLQSALPWAGSSLRGLTLAGMLLEELLLVVGLWRLSSRYFPSSATRFFVSAAGAGSSLWVDPGAANLRLFAALPLLLSLVHDLIESPSRGPLLLGCALLVLHAMGKPVAVALAVPIAVALSAVGARLPIERLRSLGLGEKIAAAGAVVLAAVVAWVTGPSGGLAGPGPGRWFQAVDLLFGLSPSTALAGYCGLLTAVFAVLALSRRVAVVLVALTAIGLLVPTLFPLVRLFVIVLSGFGFQAMIDGRFADGRAVRTAAMGLALTAVMLAAAAELMIVHYEANREITLILSLSPESPAPLSDVVGFAAMTTALASGILFLWGSGRRGAPLALGLALFFHSVDVFSWKFRMAWLNTYSPSPGAAFPCPSMAWPWAAALGLLSLFWIAWTVRETARIARGATA